MDLLLPNETFQKIVNFEYVSGETAFSGTSSIVFGLIVYFTSILALKKVLGTKKFDLHYIQAAHNFMIFLLSLVMFTSIFHEVFIVRMPQVGFFECFCDPPGLQPHGRMYFWVYIFYLSKFYEFLDTFLLVLKGKQLEFLHVYHHSLTVFNTWYALETFTSVTWVGTVLNTFVHCIMYWYYFNLSLGHQYWWKRYLTQLQMTQFIINFSGLLYWFYLKPTYNCNGSSLTSLLCLWTMVTFFLLFLRFYLRAYTAKKKSE